jgi:hypothetical protein
MSNIIVNFNFFEYKQKKLNLSKLTKRILKSFTFNLFFNKQVLTKTVFDTSHHLE